MVANFRAHLTIEVLAWLPMLLKFWPKLPEIL